MSSAEAELYGIVKATVQGMGLQSVARDLGEEIIMDIHTDSSAAIGVCNRKGVRHLDTNLLWIQDKVKQGVLKINKVHGETNPADLCAKHLDSSKMLEHLGVNGCAICAGRAE